MKTTLKDRIEAFTKEYEKLHFLHREERLAEFIRAEVNAQETEVVFDNKDLLMIEYNSSKAWQDLPKESEYNKDQKRMLAYCWTDAVLSYLRSKNLLHHIIKVHKGVTE